MRVPVNCFNLIGSSVCCAAWGGNYELGPCEEGSVNLILGSISDLYNQSSLNVSTNTINLMVSDEAPSGCEVSNFISHTKTVSFSLSSPTLTTHGSSSKIIHDQGYLMDKVDQGWMIMDNWWFSIESWIITHDDIHFSRMSIHETWLKNFWVLKYF